MATRPSPARRPDSQLTPEDVRKRSILTDTSWLPRPKLTMSEWICQGRTLGAAGRASGWWLGDWIRFGNARYGEKYELAAKITGYGIHSLMNMAYVASRFENSRRREKLSFSHHAELAALQPDEQERWLDRAEREGLSSHRIRTELRRDGRAARTSRPARRGSSMRAPATPSQNSLDSARHLPTADANIVCPHCGHPFVPGVALGRPS